MLRVAQHAERTDTGRRRGNNEDVYVARSPLFVVADGMGGAQAGEVASSTAVESLRGGIPAGEGSAEQRLLDAVQEANLRVHELALSNESYAGMGTTLTAAYVGENDVTIVHVGDSRCYRLRDGGLERLTVDHTLVEELVRQGRLAPDEAGGHPQRSIVTRVLGPEAVVHLDATTYAARDGDVFLLCSDGLTDMVGEQQMLTVLTAEPDLRAASRRLVDLANEAGGRDNITVVLFRLEDVEGGVGDEATQAIPADEVRRAVAAAGPPAEAAVSAPEPAAPEERPQPAVRRDPRPTAQPAPRRRRRIPVGAIVGIVAAVVLAAGAYLATQAVYFVGLDQDGFVTVYRGVPYDVLGLELYSEVYTSGVSGAQLTGRQRTTVTAHELRSRDDADDLVRQFELGRVGTQ